MMNGLRLNEVKLDTFINVEVWIMPYVYPAVRQIVHTSLVLKCRH